MITKENAIKELAERKANQPKQIDNSRLYAGSSMYFYCYTCGHLSDCLPESYTVTPNHTCSPCQLMKDMRWL